MKNMNDKTKKWLVVAGGLAVSAVLLVLIAGTFKTPTAQDVDIPQSSSEVQDIVVDVPDTTDKGRASDRGKSYSAADTGETCHTYTGYYPAPGRRYPKRTNLCAGVRMD